MGATVKALVFGAAAPGPRPVARDELEARLAAQPFGLHDLPEPKLPGPDWVLLEPLLAGICGSDSKLVLGEFSEGDLDNPMSAFSSLPFVPGHEVVARVVEPGPAVEGLSVADRVVLDPWLSCRPRGIEPPCPACAAGDFSLCHHFTTGPLGAGVHIGVIASLPGGWAERFVAHASMLHRVPDGLPDELAVLADPCSVSLHAVARHPPRPGERVVVYGAGSLGLTTLACIKALVPDVAVAVVARFEAQARLAKDYGADLVLSPEPRDELIERIAAWSDGVLHRPVVGLPIVHPGGIAVVYDTVGKPETIEVAVRVLASRGTVVQTGVHTPGRFEWTPLYFKEASIVGSNAFGIEEVEGRRAHAIDHYLHLADAGRIHLAGMLTHRFALSDWWEALLALARQGKSGAVKVAFEPTAKPIGEPIGEPIGLLGSNHAATASSGDPRQPA
jgi:threonine dehydrogenase-like Zn-dependent dehydrogenase